METALNESKPAGLHVDEFIDTSTGSQDKGTRYARFFFLMARLPAGMRADFDQWVSNFKLFCTFNDGSGPKRYRVTGASRLGDIWLASDFERKHGYDKRVWLDQCSDWSEDP